MPHMPPIIPPPQLPELHGPAPSQAAIMPLNSSIDATVAAILPSDGMMAA
jgi:hypothetical protein